MVFSVPWKTGSCDRVFATSGSPMSNTSGKYTCVYRGEERRTAIQLRGYATCFFKREGSGTEESPYAYDVYYLPDAAKYSGGEITDDYVKINYQLPTTAGYVKKAGI